MLGAIMRKRCGWRAKAFGCGAISSARIACLRRPPGWSGTPMLRTPRCRNCAAHSPIFRLPGSRAKCPSRRRLTAPIIWRAFDALGWSSRNARLPRGTSPVLNFSIEFGAQQDDHGGEPDPGHESEHGTERAIGLVVASEVPRVPGEQDRDEEPRDGCKRAAPRDPAPLRFRAARAIAVENGQGEGDNDQE